ncbi:MAG: transglutaminase domain-containing protein [Rufibacter sp.]
MRALFYTLFLLALPFGVVAQTAAPFSDVDQKVLQIPAQEGQTVEKLSMYLNKTFKTQPERVRAIYKWLAHNVAYDVAALNTKLTYESGQDFIAQTLKTRKALCQGYAEVFEDLCQRAGIESYLVGGYTKQNGEIDYIPHAWCAAKIDGQWFLFDPTWGAGFVMGNTFVKKFNEKFFMVQPAVMIKTHYPFDPLWQFSHSPIKSTDFANGQVVAGNIRKNFHYADTLKAYTTEDENERLVSNVRRMEAHGLANPFLVSQVQLLKQGIEINRYNTITHTYNQGIDLLNEYIYYKNHRMLTRKGETEIRRLLSQSVANFKVAKQQISTTPWQKKQDMATFAKNIEAALNQAILQEAYLDKYFKSAKVK